MRKILGNILLSAGVCFTLYSGLMYFQSISPRTVSFENAFPQNINYDTSVDSPERLIIKDLGINLPIVPTQISNNQWGLTDSGVSYLATSPLPGNQGNSVLYGHNWKSILGNLQKVKVGDTIDVVYKDGSKEFVVMYIQIVSPQDISVLDPTEDSRITLFTCTGFLDSKRLVVSAREV